MKKNIVKIGIMLMIMLCMFNVIVNAVGNFPEPEYMPDDALIGPTKLQATSNNVTMILIRLIQALLPILVMLIAIVRLIINLVKIKKIQNLEEKAKKKTKTIIELCVWIGVLVLIFLISPMISIYINMNQKIM